MPIRNTLPQVSTEYTYRGIEAAFLENEYVRITTLPGKGGDILEFRDKRKDVNVLWNGTHEWRPLDNPYVPSESATAWLDHYPGGWQMNLPVAGPGRDIPGGEYGLHGESALIPWDVTGVVERDDVAELTLEAELVRYPFSVTRTLRLPAATPQLEIEAEITNESSMALEYTWQEHIALGQPLVSGSARIDIPADRGLVEYDSEAFPNGRLDNGTSFEWPRAPGRDGSAVDLRSVPPAGAEIHDLVFATELDEGRYTLANHDLDLGFTFEFPGELFESIWYWQAFNGHVDAPFYGRNYNVGLEPTTGYPGAAQKRRSNGSMKSLGPGETQRATFTARTSSGLDDGDVVDSPTDE